MRSAASTSCRAPAKVNFLLRVLGKRPDGYHDIETLFQAVSLQDILTVELTDGSGVTLEVTGADLGPPESNLAYLAARAVLDAAGSRRGFHIHLDKHIPAGAGLGGGSSDAATTLRCTNALLDESLDRGELADIAATLGSDVPFFMGESTFALGTGRGEILRALPALPEAHLVLVLPPVHVETRWAYRALAQRRRAEPDASGFESGVDVPRDWRGIASLATNDFQELVASSHPEVARSLAGLREEGASPALMSGSGSACLGVFADGSAAARAARSLSRSLPWPGLVAHTLQGWPGPDAPAGGAEASSP